MKLVCLYFAILLLGFLYLIDDAQADNSRPAYSLIPRQALLFENYGDFPFTILRPMCWNETVGWCDAIFQTETARQMYSLIDWRNDRLGAVYEIGDECFLWIFLDEYGTDNNPHIYEANWIECPA